LETRNEVYRRKEPLSRESGIAQETKGDGIITSLARLVADEENPEVLIVRILSMLADNTGALGADLFLYHREMNILYPHRSSSTTSQWGLSDTKHNLPHKALKENKTQYVADLHDSGLQAAHAGARAMLAIPVVFTQRIHGVLSLEFQEPDSLSPEDISWVEMVALFLGGTLEVIHLKEAIFEFHRNIINQISRSMSEKDPSYSGHADRVSAYAVAIARAMDLPSNVIADVSRSGYLHDIGKVGVSSIILTKPGKLTEAEFSEVKKHAVLGRFLLEPLGFLPGVLEGIASHHERWDGNGYPNGLKGDEIPITGRILAVAEAFDTMTSNLPYRDPMSLDKALNEIKEQAGKQFDPNVVDALMYAIDCGYIDPSCK
jgi:hypothetical protein